MKENVLSSFKEVGSKLKLVIATTTMDVDCPDIREVVLPVPLKSAGD